MSGRLSYSTISQSVKDLAEEQKLIKHGYDNDPRYPNHPDLEDVQRSFLDAMIMNRLVDGQFEGTVRDRMDRLELGFKTSGLADGDSTASVMARKYKNIVDSVLDKQIGIQKS
ncbi:MAG: hypothetical protein ACOYJ2_07825 [Rickettsiales bacterium]